MDWHLLLVYGVPGNHNGSRGDMFDGVNWADLQTCVLARWSPTIGDPNVTGWLTVAAYLACALLAYSVQRRAADPGRERAFWVIIAVAMLFLAINKQLDLQSALTATGRCISQIQGWYDQRREFQRHFIEALLAVTLFGLCLGLYLMRKYLRNDGLALVGLAFVAGFVAVRAVGFHHFDTVLNTKVLDLRFNFIFELSGLVLLALNAILLLKRARERRR